MMKETHKEYWNAFNQYLADKGSKLDYKKSTLTEQYHNINLGKGWVHIELVANNKENRVALYLNGTEIENKKRFLFLKEKYEKEAASFFGNIKWCELPGKKLSKVSMSREGGLKKKGDRDEQFKWLDESAEKIRFFFKSKLDQLDTI